MWKLSYWFLDIFCVSRNLFVRICGIDCEQTIHYKLIDFEYDIMFFIDCNGKKWDIFTGIGTGIGTDNNSCDFCCNCENCHNFIDEFVNVSNGNANMIKIEQSLVSFGNLFCSRVSVDIIKQKNENLTNLTNLTIGYKNVEKNVNSLETIRYNLLLKCIKKYCEDSGLLGIWVVIWTTTQINEADSFIFHNQNKIFIIYRHIQKTKDSGWIQIKSKKINKINFGNISEEYNFLSTSLSTSLSDLSDYSPWLIKKTQKNTKQVNIKYKIIDKTLCFNNKNYNFVLYSIVTVLPKNINAVNQKYSLTINGQNSDVHTVKQFSTENDCVKISCHWQSE